MLHTTGAQEHAGAPANDRLIDDDIAVLSPDEAEHDALSGDDYYDDESSDGELDWDPDRERLLRTLRQTGGGGTTGSSSYHSGSAKSLAERCVSCPTSCSDGRLCCSRSCTVAQAAAKANCVAPRVVPGRRNEWRASRGLERQKSVAEILAERRASREAGRAGTASLAPLHAPSDRSLALEPFSADRALELGGRSGAAERAAAMQGVSETGNEAAAAAGVTSAEAGGQADHFCSSGSGSSAPCQPDEGSSARGARGRTKKGWPWRTR